VLQQPGLPDLKSLAREMMQQYRTLVRQLLHQAIARGDIAADLNLDAAATMFLGQLQGLVMQSLMTGQSATMLRQAPAVFELFQRALRQQP
jgi:hypothetical protein